MTKLRSLANARKRTVPGEEWITALTQNGRVFHARTNFEPWIGGRGIRYFTVVPDPDDPTVPRFLKVEHEDVTWTRGHHADGSREVDRLLAAEALR